MQRILVIDDDESVRDLLETFFSDKGFEVKTAPDGESGVELLRNEQFDLFFVDLVMPGMGGLEVLGSLSESGISTPGIVITAFGAVNTAVEAMKLGAFDYTTKPFMLDELLILANRALSVSKLEKENLLLKKQLRKKYDFHGLIGNSPEMLKVYRLIEKIADTDSTVIISGESGTGKEVVAKTIHYNSPRAQKLFVPINCAAIPKDLLESELFGHEKGAFTGAISTRIGRFELANSGTILLDEIAELHPSLQVKLLRVLQEREFERVGGTKTIKVDVRVIAATNTDIEKATQEGRFREDLFYRLNVIPLHLPPLRDRVEDIPLLAEHFMDVFCRRKKKAALKILPRTMECFLRYPWPGNVRELENTIERIVILNDTGVVTPEELPERFLSGIEPAGQAHVKLNPSDFLSGAAAAGTVPFPDGGIDLNEIVNELETGLIIQALQKSGGVKKQAAELLGLNRTTLLEKMKKKNISYESPGSSS